MDKMTDSRAVEVLERLEKALPDIGVNGWIHGVAAVQHAIARLREPAEAQAQDGGEVAYFRKEMIARCRKYAAGMADIGADPRDLEAALAPLLCAATSNTPVGVELDAAALGRFAQDAWMDSHANYPAWGRLTDAERAAWVAVGERIKRVLAQQSAPIAPVGVEAQVSALQSVRDRMMAALTPKFGDAFDGDFDVMLEAINTMKRFRTATLAQQPAAVVGTMVERALNARYNGYDVACYIDEKADGRGVICAALTAALAAQPGGSQ